MRSRSRPPKKSMVLLKNDGASFRSRATVQDHRGHRPQRRLALRPRRQLQRRAARPGLPRRCPAPTSSQAARILYAQGSPYADGVALPVPRTMLPPGRGLHRQGLQGRILRHRQLRRQARRHPHRQADRLRLELRQPRPRRLRRTASPCAGPASSPPRNPAPTTSPCASPTAIPAATTSTSPSTSTASRSAAFASPAGAESRASGTPRFTINFADTQAARSSASSTIHNAPLFGAGITLEWVPTASMLQKASRSRRAAGRRRRRLRRPLARARRRRDARPHRRLLRRRPHRHQASRRPAAAARSRRRHRQAAGRRADERQRPRRQLGAASTPPPSSKPGIPARPAAQAIAETLSGKQQPRRPPARHLLRIHRPAPRLRRLLHGGPHLPLLQRQAALRLRLRPQLHHLRLLRTSSSPPRSCRPATPSPSKPTSRTPARAPAMKSPSSTSPRRRPPSLRALELAGFHRVHLAPGATQHVVFHLDPRTLSQVDEKAPAPLHPAATPSSSEARNRGSHPGARSPERRSPSPSKAARNCRTKPRPAHPELYEDHQRTPDHLLARPQLRHAAHRNRRRHLRPRRRHPQRPRTRRRQLPHRARPSLPHRPRSLRHRRHLAVSLSRSLLASRPRHHDRHRRRRRGAVGHQGQGPQHPRLQPARRTQPPGRASSTPTPTDATSAKPSTPCSSTWRKAISPSAPRPASPASPPATASPRPASPTNPPSAASPAKASGPPSAI